MAQANLSVAEFLASSVTLDEQLKRAQSQQRRNSAPALLPTLLGRLARRPSLELDLDKPVRRHSFLASWLSPKAASISGPSAEEAEAEMLASISKTKYIVKQTLREALVERDTVLIKGSWLLRQWRQDSRGFRLLPRQEMEQMHPGSIWGVDELSQAQAASTAGIVAISHCWLSEQHPDPSGENLGTLCRALDMMLRGSALQDVALFIDYCSLYQAPRTGRQEAAYTRAIADSHLWYLHQSTRVWLLTGVPGTAERGEAYEERAMPLLQRALADMVTGVQSATLDLGRLKDSCQTWQDVQKACRHQRQPPLIPKAFEEVLCRQASTQKQEAVFAKHKYNEAFLEAIAAAQELSFSSLDWSDVEAKKISQLLPHCRRLEKLSLHNNNISEKGVSDLVKAVPKCKALKELWLIRNPVIKAPKDVREKLFASWEKSGLNRDNLHM